MNNHEKLAYLERLRKKIVAQSLSKEWYPSKRGNVFVRHGELFASVFPTPTGYRYVVGLDNRNYTTFSEVDYLTQKEAQAEAEDLIARINGRQDYEPYAGQYNN